MSDFAILFLSSQFLSVAAELLHYGNRYQFVCSSCSLQLSENRFMANPICEIDQLPITLVIFQAAWRVSVFFSFICFLYFRIYWLEFQGWDMYEIQAHYSRAHSLHNARGTMRLLHAAIAIVTMSAVFGVARAQGTWSTAQLSEARYSLTSTSVDNFSIFAGGTYGTASKSVDLYNSATGVWSTAQLSMARFDLAATSLGSLAIFAGGRTGNAHSNSVDFYSSVTGAWSTAQLSMARTDLAATSLGSLAIFAGGHTGNASSNTVDFYNSASGAWTTARLSFARRLLVATSVGNMAIFAGGLVDPSGGHQEGTSDVVDLYNNVTDTWSTARLSLARFGLRATSIGNLALFRCSQ